MIPKKKSAVIRYHHTGVYIIEQLKNCLAVRVGTRDFRVNDALNNKLATELAQDRTIEVTVKAMD